MEILDCTDNNERVTTIMKGNNYTLDDCVLVRTTNNFPFNKIINTPVNSNDVILGESFIVNSAIYSLLKKENPNYYKNIANFFDMLSDYRVACKNYRSTIHFSLNGLVGNHAYGVFSDRKFIIIEPLRYHIKDKSLLSLGSEDTYFDKDIELSSDAIILMNKDVYHEISTNDEYYDTLRFLNIIVYKGYENIAVSKVLNSLGYDSFLVNGNGYVDGLNNNTPAYNMEKCIRELRGIYGKGYNRHFNSIINYNDSKATNRNSVASDLEHFFYILERAKDDGLINDNVIEKVKEARDIDEANEIDYTDSNYRMHELSTCDSTILRIVPILVEKIGLDNIKRYTKEFNEEFIKKLNNKSHMHR